jgi:hypothetical protein
MQKRGEEMEKEERGEEGIPILYGCQLINVIGHFRETPSGLSRDVLP